MYIWVANIFAKTLKASFLDFLSPPWPSELFSKTGMRHFSSSPCLTSQKKKWKRTDNHWRQMERRTKPKLCDFCARVGVQQVFASRRGYGLSVAVWWYILVGILMKLLLSQGLIQAETTVSTKISILSKGSKDGKEIKLKYIFRVSFIPTQLQFN